MYELVVDGHTARATDGELDTAQLTLVSVPADYITAAVLFCQPERDQCVCVCVYCLAYNTTAVQHASLESCRSR